MPAQRWHLWEEGRDKDPTQGRQCDTSPSPAAIITSDLIILMGTRRGKEGRQKTGADTFSQAKACPDAQQWSQAHRACSLDIPLSHIPWEATDLCANPPTIPLLPAQRLLCPQG